MGEARLVPGMNSILEPLLAIFAIVVPLGLAYFILMLQSSNQDRVLQKETHANKNQCSERES